MTEIVSTATMPIANGINGHKETGLKILIIGAGIGGLSSAIGLRKHGHNVHV